MPELSKFSKKIYTNQFQKIGWSQIINQIHCNVININNKKKTKPCIELNPNLALILAPFRHDYIIESYSIPHHPPSTSGLHHFFDNFRIARLKSKLIPTKSRRKNQMTILNYYKNVHKSKQSC